MKKKRPIILIVMIIILILVGIWSFFSYQEAEQEKRKRKKEEQEQTKIEKIKSHYAQNVEVMKTCKIYEKKNKKYQEVGTIEKGELLTLAMTDDFTTPYFEIENKKKYILDTCIAKTEQEKIEDHRYQHYIPFPEKIKTKEKVTLYRENKKTYELFYPIEGQVIKKEENAYHIEYFGELFKILKTDIQEVKELEETKFATEIPVTAYHFIHKEEDTSCTSVICHPISQIRSHFEYLTQNQYFTITTKEMEEFLDKKIRLPEKSILITIDDGDKAENIVPLLNEFKVNATLFLITAWYFKDNYQSPYLEFGSHTNELHEPGRCTGGQGSALKCIDKKEIVADLKKSKSILNDTISFCYPLYEYNNHAVEAVKEAGFHLGFIGGQRKATLKSEKLLIPRITIHRNTTLEEYIKIVS